MDFGELKETAELPYRRRFRRRVVGGGGGDHRGERRRKQAEKMNCEGFFFFSFFFPRVFDRSGDGESVKKLFMNRAGLCRPSSDLTSIVNSLRTSGRFGLGLKQTKPKLSPKRLFDFTNSRG